MSKIGFETRIIGRCGNLLLLSNDFNASLDGVRELAYIVEADTGKQLTGEATIDFLFRMEEDLEWTPADEFYYDAYPDRAKDNLAVDGLIGFAVGDALGVPVEFLDRDTVRKINVQDMMGKDTNINFKSRWGNLIPSGAWSDDTSMIYASMDSMVRSDGIDYDDMMKSYINWWTKGEYSSLGSPFGLGGTVNDALSRYHRGTPALECGGKNIRDNGNGALMRIFPFSLYCIENDLSEEETARVISEGSAITHGHDISKMSCFIYTEFMKSLIETKNPYMAISDVQAIDYSKYFSDEAIAAHSKILNRYFIELSEDDVKGSGYVVDSLECALLSLIKTENYEDAVKMAINTGYDTDTIGGITGCLAGMLYGKDNIPERWINKLRKKEDLEFIAFKFKCFLDSTKKNELDEMIDDKEKEDFAAELNNSLFL